MATTIQHRFRLELPPVPGAGDCPASFQEYSDWLERNARLLSGTEVPFSLGADTPAVESRALPWYRLDQNGKAVGWYFWDPNSGECGEWRCVPACLQKGTLRTVARTETTLAVDRSEKSLEPSDGWQLAINAPNLKENSSFFDQEDPDNPSYYTVIYTG